MRSVVLGQVNYPRSEHCVLELAVGGIELRFENRIGPSLNFRAKARDNVSSPRSPATAVPTAGVVINLVNISTE